MKIAITGSSRGLGKAIADYCDSLNHTTMRLDSKTDLRSWEVRQKLYKNIDDFNVFISVAKPDFTQTEILFELFDKWQDKNKIIISIGSEIVEFDSWGNSIGMIRYFVQKKSLQLATHELQKLNSKCKVILINPEHLYDKVIDKKSYDYIFLNNWCKTNLDIIR